MTHTKQSPPSHRPLWNPPCCRAEASAFCWGMRSAVVCASWAVPSARPPLLGVAICTALPWPADHPLGGKITARRCSLALAVAPTLLRRALALGRLQEGHPKRDHVMATRRTARTLSCQEPPRSLEQHCVMALEGWLTRDHALSRGRFHASAPTTLARRTLLQSPPPGCSVPVLAVPAGATCHLAHDRLLRRLLLPGHDLPLVCAAKRGADSSYWSLACVALLSTSP